MGNSNAPHGFEPINTLHGAGFRVQEFVKLAANGAAIFRNDVAVHLTGSGSPKNSEGRVVGICTAAFTPGTTLEAGVFMNFAPASTLSDHQVLIDPMLIMEAQDDGSTNPTSGNGTRDADFGKNANLTTGTAGTSFGSAAGKQGLSGEQIDATSIATTNTLDFHLIELLQVSEALGGNAAGANARCIVMFNRHRDQNQIAGV